MDCGCNIKKDYVEERKEIFDFLDGYEKNDIEGLAAAHAVVEYAQFIDKIDFVTAKDILYRFVERLLHPEWE